MINNIILIISMFISVLCGVFITLKVIYKNTIHMIYAVVFAIAVTVLITFYIGLWSFV